MYLPVDCVDVCVGFRNFDFFLRAVNVVFVDSVSTSSSSSLITD